MNGCSFNCKGSFRRNLTKLSPVVIHLLLNMLLNRFLIHLNHLLVTKKKSSFYCCKIVKLQWTTLKKVFQREISRPFKLLAISFIAWLIVSVYFCYQMLKLTQIIALVLWLPNVSYFVWKKMFAWCNRKIYLYQSTNSLHNV